MTPIQRLMSSIGVALMAALVTFPLYEGNMAYAIAVAASVAIGFSTYYIMQQRQASNDQQSGQQQNFFSSLEASITDTQKSNVSYITKQLANQQDSLQSQFAEQLQQTYSSFSKMIEQQHIEMTQLQNHWLTGQENYQNKLTATMAELKEVFSAVTEKVNVSIIDQNKESTKIMDRIAENTDKQVNTINDLKTTVVQEQKIIADNWQKQFTLYNEQQVQHANRWAEVSGDIEKDLTKFLTEQSNYHNQQVDYVNSLSNTTKEVAAQLNTYIKELEEYTVQKHLEEQAASAEHLASSKQQQNEFLAQQQKCQSEYMITFQGVYQEQLDESMQRVSTQTSQITTLYTDIIKELQKDYSSQASNIAEYQEKAFTQSKRIMQQLQQYEIDSTKSQQKQRDAVIEKFRHELTKMTGTLKELQLNEWKQTTEVVTERWKTLTEKTVEQIELASSKFVQQYERLFKEVEKQTADIHESQAEVVHQQKEQLVSFTTQRKHEQEHINKQLAEQLNVFYKAQDSYELLTDSTNAHHGKLQELAEKITLQQDTVSDSYSAFKTELTELLKHNEQALQEVSITLDDSIQMAQKQFEQQTSSLTAIMGAIGEEVQSTSQKFLESRAEEVNALQSDQRKSERSRKVIEKDIKRLAEDVSNELHSVEKLQKMIKDDTGETAEQFKYLTSTFREQVVQLNNVVQLMSNNYDEMTKLNKADLSFLEKLLT